MHFSQGDDVPAGCPEGLHFGYLNSVAGHLVRNYGETSVAPASVEQALHDMLLYSRVWPHS
jgi:hypothetical protein